MTAPVTKTEPMDMSMFSDAALDQMSGGATEHTALVPVSAAPATSVVAAPAIPPLEKQVKLVDINTFTRDELAEAHAEAEVIDFNDLQSLINAGHGAMDEAAQVAKRVLATTTLGGSGEVGQIAASVLEGIRILRLDDLMAEAKGIAHRVTGSEASKPGFMSRLIHGAGEAKSALQGFAASRVKFDQFMAKVEQRANVGKASLNARLTGYDEQDQALRKAIRNMKISVGACQIALDRGYAEEDQKWRQVVACTDRTEAMRLAAYLMEFRANLINFDSKTFDMKENIIKTAQMIGIIGLSKRSTATRLMKLDTGIFQTLPHLMIAASNVIGQYETKGLMNESAQLSEADRQVTLLASAGAREASLDAARSLKADPRNIEVLKTVAKEYEDTMREVIEIDAQTMKDAVKREQELVAIRDGMLKGMIGVQRKMLETSARTGERHAPPS